MISRKLFIVIAFVIFIISYCISTGVHAATTSSNPLDFCSQPEFANSDVCSQKKPYEKISDPNNGIFTQIVKVIIFLTASVSTLFVIIGAFKYVTSQGEAGQIKSAKDTITYALVGLFVAISAFVIVSFVVSKI